MENAFLKEKKILLVDDEPELLRLVAQILRDGGFRAVQQFLKVPDMHCIKVLLLFLLFS